MSQAENLRQIFEYQGSNMKLLQMRYFQTVCQYGSITRAAEELFVSRQYRFVSKN